MLPGPRQPDRHSRPERPGLRARPGHGRAIPETRRGARALDSRLRLSYPRGLRPGDYIRSLFEERDRVSLVAIPRAAAGGDVLQKVYSAEVVAADRTQAWLRHLNANRHDLFLGVNPVRPGAWGRTKAAIGDVMRVYLDIDEDGEKALARILSDSRAGRLPAPTHVVRSSPGRFQVLWSVPRGALDHDRAEALTKGLAIRYGADTQVIDVARVLRIPGYRNWKRGGVPCALVASTSRVAQVREFPADLPAPGNASPVPARTSEPGPSAGGDNSPSGRDWAWVRGELRAERDPEALVAALAVRRRDKPKPLAYARRTVDRAVESLRAEREKRLRRSR